MKIKCLSLQCGKFFDFDGSPYKEHEVTEIQCPHCGMQWGLRLQPQQDTPKSLELEFREAEAWMDILRCRLDGVVDKILEQRDRMKEIKSKIKEMEEDD